MEPSQQTQPTLLYEVRDHVATITLNRPEALNAFNDDLLGNWELALDRAQRDQDVRVVLVTGTGRAFCSAAMSAPWGRSEDSTPITRRNRLKETVTAWPGRRGTHAVHCRRERAGRWRGHGHGEPCDIGLRQ
jgi:enoyl-CoA hydratase/carnithine racemase